MTPEEAQALRAPFPPETIGKLPKPYRKDSPKGTCPECGNYHGLPAVHLDYVGHAAVTDRLLQVDPGWTWEPVATDPATGAPLMASGGLWIRLTVAGVTRIGYGDGQSVKECIGDAIRNACLARGTLITTRRGQVPIECVRVGDLVLNRSGWHPVTDHWLSDHAARVVRVTLDSGATVVGTPNHRVPTPLGGTTLGQLSNGAMMFAWATADLSKAPRLSSGTGVSGGEPLVGVTSSPRPHLASSSTERSTAARSGLSRGGGTSTTGTTTLPTTERGTLSRWTPSATAPSTSARTSAGMRRPADGAAGTSWAECHGLGGALRPARRLSAVLTAWLTSALGRVRSVKIASARSATPSTSPASRGHGIALARVVSVQDAGTAEVWNLSVGDVHEYIAGGVCVYNSMRFGVALDLWAKESLVEGQHDAEAPGISAPDPAKQLARQLRLDIASLANRYGWDLAVLGQEFTQTYGVSTSTAGPGDLADYLSTLTERAEQADLEETVTATPETALGAAVKRGALAAAGMAVAVAPEVPLTPPDAPEPENKPEPKPPEHYRDLLLTAPDRETVVRVLRDASFDKLADAEVADQDGVATTVNNLAMARMKELK